jgi:sodium transport system permease protein
MRWPILRLIWLRELRDQLRDRRTVFMIAVLPVLIYPLAGRGMMQLFQGQVHVVGIAGAENLLPAKGAPRPTSPTRAASWFTVTPPPPGDPAGVARIAGAAAFVLAQPPLDYPELIVDEEGQIAFAPRYLNPSASPLLLRRLEGAVPVAGDPDRLLAPYRRWLDERKADVVLVVPPGFRERLERGERPALCLFTREKDDVARVANARVTLVLSRWLHDLKLVRLARAGLPGDFDVAAFLYDPEQAKSVAEAQEESLVTLLVRVFPFILVLWSLAGALYPAVDLCAGEKERGTMETLLISPASREEIVYGKFLTIWLFSAVTALLNLLSMAVTVWQLGAPGGATGFRFAVLFWSLVLLLPLSAFFSAVCLAVGAYARSSKEGQYYLMPLFLVTMPLIFLTLMPGVELNPFYSMVPVTGVALLLQKLVAAESADPGLYLYFVPVLAPMVIYSWLALRWAVWQFQREEVLFREAERLDLGLWLKRLLGEKEALPTAGEALFCFAAILGLRWLSFGIGEQLPLLARTGVGQLAFVATPPLFMAILLTTRPGRGLGLRLPPWWAWPAAVLLAVLVVPPLAELTLAILRQFPVLKTLLELNHPLTRELHSLAGADQRGAWGGYILVLALLPALCEELAFRGFILQGLLRGFRPWPAILLSAFLFALYQMNVFQFLPHFVFGVILGVLVVRSGSVLPAMVFHLVYNSLLLAPAVLPGVLGQLVPSAQAPTVARLAVALVSATVACAAMYVIARPAKEAAAS